MLSPTLIGDQVVQVREPREKRLLASLGMVKALHREQLPLEGVMGLIQQRARDGHPRVCKHRIPTGLLLLGSVSKVEMAAPMALICKVLFPSISTFETPPDFEWHFGRVTSLGMIAITDSR